MTHATGDIWIRHRKRSQTWAGLLIAALIGVAGTPAHAGDGEDKPDSWLERSNRLMDLTRAPMTMLESNSPFFQRRQLYFFGRLEGDAAHFSSGVLSDDSGFEVRRFRAGLVGHLRFTEQLDYMLEFDLTDSESSLSDAYLNWAPGNWGTIRLGNQKVSQSLSGSTSTLTIPFMERPLPVLAFTLQRRLGLGYEVHRDSWGLYGAVFGHNINEQYGSQGYSARAYYLLGSREEGLWHLGASAVNLDPDDAARFRARPESHVTDTRLVDTGEFSDVDDARYYHLELATVRGSYSVRGEYHRAVWERSNGSIPQFEGWYVEGSYLLRGYQQAYRKGKFFRPEVESERGAWELALRYSTLDLDSRGVSGGREDNWSVGVNWYSPLHWRVMANLIRVDADGPEGRQDPWITQARVQYYF